GRRCEQFTFPPFAKARRMGHPSWCGWLEVGWATLPTLPPDWVEGQMWATRLLSVLGKCRGYAIHVKSRDDREEGPKMNRGIQALVDFRRCWAMGRGQSAEVGPQALNVCALRSRGAVFHHSAERVRGIMEE